MNDLKLTSLIFLNVILKQNGNNCVDGKARITEYLSKCSSVITQNSAISE
jgi:hypothetical protein